MPTSRWTAGSRCSVRAMEYYSAVRRSEALTHAAVWMTSGAAPSERSQTQEATYCVIPGT